MLNTLLTMKRLLLLATVLFAFEYASAQSGCAPNACVGNNVPLVNNCADACVLCDLDGFSSRNDVATGGQQIPAGFCATVFHNLQWVGFVAGSPTLSMNINITNCTVPGDGLQIGIYGTTDCNNFNLVSNCNGAAGPGVHAFNANGLVPGQTYYLVIDGNNGDICDFSVDITSGTTAVQPPVGPPPPINVPTSICPGGTLFYGVDGGSVPNAGFYDWTIDGSLVGCEASGSWQVPPGTPDGTPLQICYQASNPCFPPLNQVCTTITVEELDPQNQEAQICEGESYTFFTQTITPPGPGIYDFSTVETLPSGCVRDVNLELEVIANVEVNIQDEICQQDLPYLVGGQPLSPPPFPGSLNSYSIPLQSAVTGCDSVVNLELTVHPTNAPPFGPPVIINEEICEGESVSVGNNEYGPGLSPQTDPYIFDENLTSVFGCDSLVILRLQVYEVPQPQNFTETICEGEFYELGGAFYDSPGIYSATLPSAGGCDSVVTVNLDVYYDPQPVVDTTLCDGASITIGGQTFDETGNYQIVETSFLGCDSTINLNLTVLDPIDTTLFIEICESESFDLGGNTYNTTGMYQEVLTASNGCDSTVFLDLTVFPEPVTDLNETVCFGDSFSVGDSTYNATGDFTTILTTSEGCDSTVNLVLTVLPLIQDTVTSEICDGETYTIGASVYDSTGFYADTLIAPNGCDSIVYTDLTVLEIPETFLDIAICDGESYMVGGSTYNASGSYTDVLTAASGCDSIVYLDLNVISAFETFLDIEICSGISYTVGSSVYTDPGSYVDTLTASIGCDSIIYLDLMVSDILIDSLDVAICDGESYNFAGTDYSVGGNYQADFVTAEGCDSSAFLTLTVLPVPETFLTPTICDGESFAVGASVYSATGAYQDTLTAINGCDSIVFTDLTVLPVPNTNLTEAICDGETFTVGASDYTAAGSYVDTLSAANGCDSIVFLDLTVLPVPNANLTEAICDGETFTVGASDYSTAGNYVDTLTAANGCDSIVFLDLTILDVPVTNIDTLICEGETLAVGPSIYTSSGSYADTLTATNGCDSIVLLDLVVFETPVTNLDISICEGSSFTVGGSTYDADGVYTDTLTASVGCDSIVVLNLTVTDFYQTPVAVTLCEGESYTLGGTPYSATGVYEETFVAADGCDSIVTLTLTVLPNAFTELDESICQGESIPVGDSFYSVSGNYVDTLVAANGCDSVVELNLLVLPVFETSLTESICDGESFVVGSSVYTENGLFTDTLTAINGCDSIVKLELTVFPIPATQLIDTICFGDSYPVGTSSYSATGVYVDTLAAFTGCDSIVTLDLTVRDLIETDLTDTICNGATFSVGSSVYDATGFYVDTLTAANGCDSIVRLDLTERDLIETFLDLTICDGESVTVGASTYNEPGDYQDVLLSEATGCDSIVNLTLTVNPVYDIALSEAICAGETFAVGSSVYDATGVYVDTLSTVDGCDSLVTLELTVNPIPETFLTEVLCSGDSIAVGSSTYAAGGQYIDTLTAFTGCDSIVYLDLTVEDLIETNLVEVICFDETYTVGNSTYEATGVYVDTLTAVGGCDSIVRLDLTERDLIETDLMPTICEGETFAVGTSAYESSGFYIDTLLSAATGCDSIVRTDLTVIPTDTTFLTEAICDGETFAVGASVYTETGFYEDLLSSVITGCDSVVFFDLTVYEIPQTTLTPTICEGEAFAVGDTSYTETGQYTDILTAFTGCDSIVQTDLIVIPTAETFLTEAICASETYAVGGSVYDETGQHVDTLVAAASGCDSIVYLDLTVNPEYDILLVEDICDDETFSVGAESFSTTGVYEVLLTSAAGCDSLVTLELTTFPCQLDLAVAETEATCNGEANGAVAFTLFVGTPPYTYTWQAASGSLSGEGTIEGNNLETRIDSLPAGNYDIEILDSYGIAASITATVAEPAPLTLTMSATEYAGGYNLSCPGEGDGSVEALAAGGTAPYSYTWSNGATGSQLSLAEAGSHVVTVTDQNGCAATAEVVLSAPAPLAAAVSTEDPPCYGDDRGTIRFDTVTGGVGPYLYAIEDGAFAGNRLFSNLEIGAYRVFVQDANGCIWEDEVVINQPGELVVDLGDEFDEIKQGETVNLFAEVNLLPVDTFIWETLDSLSCYDCPDPSSRPLSTTTYRVTVINENGCSATDEITIIVEKPYEVYIPNAFSPDGDGINDRLVVFAGDDVAEVRSLQIYNRWGEPMYEIYNGFPPNDETFGWDGTHRGQVMNPGIYVYTVEVEFIDGNVELFYGDVLLVR